MSARACACPTAGQPWCNSHYTRQLIGWAVPAALSGQRFDLGAAPRPTLTLQPAEGAPRRLPVFNARFSGTVDVADALLVVHSGSAAGLDVWLRDKRVRVVHSE